MTNMPVYMHFLYSTIATIGFSIFLNVPKSALIPSGITGGIGWSLYYCLISATNNDILSNFLAKTSLIQATTVAAKKLDNISLLVALIKQ